MTSLSINGHLFYIFKYIKKCQTWTIISASLTLKVEGKDKKLSTLEVKAEVRDLTAPPAMEHKHQTYSPLS